MTKGYLIDFPDLDPELDPFDESLPPGVVSSISMCYTIRDKIYRIKVKAKVPVGMLYYSESDMEETPSFEKMVKKAGVVLERIGIVLNIRHTEAQKALNERGAAQPRLIHSMQTNVDKSVKKITAAHEAALKSLEYQNGAPPATFHKEIPRALNRYLDRVIDHRPRKLGISPPL